MSTLPPGYPVGPPPGGPTGYSPARYPALPYGPPPGYGVPPAGYYGPQPGYGAPPGSPQFWGPAAGNGAPPAYGPPPGYGQPPGPQQFGPLTPVFGPFKPGIIPLRPLSLTDIFNGSVGYIRKNPKATLGLTAMVVVLMQIVKLAATLGPLAAYGRLEPDKPGQLTLGAFGAWIASMLAGALVNWLASMLLSGMLTVIVGRAVFGSPITIGETWAKIRGRLLPLLGLALLEGAVVTALIGLTVVIITMVAAVGNGALAALFALPLLLVVLALMVYLYTVVLFAPVLIVLERLPVTEAMTRSFALVRNSFWRVLGIRLLTFIVATALAEAMAAPFSIVGRVMLAGGSTGALVFGTTIASIGSAIGQIVTSPFSAGVVVLLYTDRRIRAEAFDLVLQTGATSAIYGGAPTDDLWLTRANSSLPTGQ